MKTVKPVATQEAQFFTVSELMARWKISQPTVLVLIKPYPVLNFNNPTGPGKRHYTLKRIPMSTVQAIEATMTQVVA